MRTRWKFDTAGCEYGQIYEWIIRFCIANQNCIRIVYVVDVVH